MRRLLTLTFVFACMPALAARHELALQATRADALGALRTGDSVVVDDFPDGYGGRASLRFTRIDIYAAGARLIVQGPDGERELPRSTRIEMIGRDAGDQVRAQLAFDPGLRNIAGAGSGPSGAFAVSARTDARGLHFVVQPADEALPKGVVPQVLPDDGSVMGLGTPPDPLPLSAGGGGTTATPRGALIAVDVDHELLVNRFGGTGASNLTAASNWIADLFATMNVMYVRDLNVMLQQGTTIFRTGATPYTIALNAAANGTDLNNFGNYWQASHAAVDRDFTLLLSGQMTSGFSASGIAWINSYCNRSGSGGSYSVNKVFTSSQVPVDLSARIVGHELGHNFGAAHTHCTNTATGNYPSSSNTIDTCLSGESMPGGACYSGAISCPASGPGHPLGTLMSYCNIPVNFGGPGCGQNVLQFHPAQITPLLALVASHTPACLSATADVIFKNGFD